MRDDRGPAADHLDNGTQKSGERDFAKIAKRKAGDRDAHLDAGDDAAEIADEQFDNLARASPFDKLANARKADGNQRKFRGRKKGIHADQENDAEDVERAHRRRSRQQGGILVKETARREKRLLSVVDNLQFGRSVFLFLNEFGTAVATENCRSKRPVQRVAIDGW